MREIIDFTVHFYFRFAYEGQELYSEVNIHHCSNPEILIAGGELYETSLQEKREFLADQLGIPVENVVPITYQEYKENTEED